MPSEMPRKQTELTTGDLDQLPPDFARQPNVLGSIKGLREDINTLAELMGGRKKALQALSQAAEISTRRILAIISIPDTVNFSEYINPFSGEPADPNDFLPDPNADTAMEATKNVFNTGLRKVLEEVLH